MTMQKFGNCVTCAFLIFLVSMVTGQVYPRTVDFLMPRNTTDDFLNEFNELEGLFKMLTKALTNRTVYNEVTSGDHDVKPDCLNDTMVVIEGILNRDRNAFLFLDSDFKPPGGILAGNLFWTGEFSECISIDSLYNAFTKNTIQGKYFTVLLKPKSIPSLPYIGVGICLPNTCDASDAKSLISLALSPGQPASKSSVLKVFDIDEPTMSLEAIAAIVVISFIVTMVIIGTAIDIYETNFMKTHSVISNGDVKVTENGILENSETTRLLNTPFRVNEANTNTKHGVLRALKAFSFFTNSTKLMNTSTANSPLACLNGLRVISICWVIQGHTYEFSTPFLANSVYTQETLARRFTFQAIINGTYSVDTFFFMSGLLVAFLALKEIKSKGRLNWLYYFGHRFWRLTPMYAFVLFAFATLPPYLVHGPFRWFMTDSLGPLYTQVNQCHHYWWSNLIYINNLYPDYGSLQGCMSWTWYLANDMQFYVFIAPLVLFLLNKNKTVGIVYSGLLVLACVTVRGILSAYYDTDQFGRPSKHLDSPWAKKGPMYQYPYTRWSVYVVGLLTGFVLHHSNCKVRINKICAFIGWILSSAGALLVIYGLYHYRRDATLTMPKFGSRLYNATSRTVWSLCLSWLVVACASGRGGWVNTILSWKPWAPLGRLTYAAYLIHPIVLVVFWGNQTSNVQFTDLLLIYIFISNVVLTYGLSYLVSMVIEAPMMQLEKIILNR